MTDIILFQHLFLSSLNVSISRVLGISMYIYMMYIAKLCLRFHDVVVLLIPNLNPVIVNDLFTRTNPNLITIFMPHILHY